MNPVAFREPLPADRRLTLFSNDKLDRFFTIIKFWMDETSGVPLALQTGVPTDLLIHLPIEEEDNNRPVHYRCHRLREYSVLCHSARRSQKRNS